MSIHHKLIFGSLILILVFTSGCFYLLEEEPDIPTRNRSWIDSETDEFVWIMGTGEFHWDNYRVIVREGNESITLKTEDGKITKYGDEASFKDPLGTWDPILAEECNIKIINLKTDKVVWEDDIRAE